MLSYPCVVDEHILERKTTKSGDIEKCNLISALLVISPSQLYRLAKITHIAVLTDIILIAFRHNKITPIIRANIKTGDNSLGEFRLLRAGTWDNCFPGIRQKILQQGKSCLTAFFGMKLGSENIVFLNSRDKLVLVVSGCQHKFF